MAYPPPRPVPPKGTLGRNRNGSRSASRPRRAECFYLPATRPVSGPRALRDTSPAPSSPDVQGCKPAPCHAHRLSQGHERPVPPDQNRLIPHVPWQAPSFYAAYYNHTTNLLQHSADMYLSLKIV